MERTGQFPPYVIKMVEVGQASGNLDVVMQALAQYYENERTLAKAIRSAVVYPVIMITILLVVLFVLLTRVLPVFEQVYVQLGAQGTPAIRSAIEVGGTITLGLFIFFAVVVAAIWIVRLLESKGNVQWAEGLLHILKERTKIGTIIAKRRFTSIMSLTVASGMDLGKGMELAVSVVGQRRLENQVASGKKRLDEGEALYDILKDMGIFRGMELQIIQVGSRSGKLENAFEYLSAQYEQDGDDAIAGAVARLEPILVIVMTLTVGLILLSVMVPLIEIMASIG